MFGQMFHVLMAFYSSSYLVPYWIACGAVVVAGSCVVVIKGVCFHV